MKFKCVSVVLQHVEDESGKQAGNQAVVELRSIEPGVEGFVKLTSSFDNEPQVGAEFVLTLASA